MTENRIKVSFELSNFTKEARTLLRSIAPEWALTSYRRVRTLNRYLFFKPKNARVARVYRDLILVRFPELKKTGNQGLVIDLGANVGNFTHACRLMGYEVIAVEPHPRALEYLGKRFRDDGGVRIISAAIGQNEGGTELHFHSDHVKDPIQTSISASTVADKFSESHTTTRVKTLTLAQLLGSTGPVTILKSDIEGAEYGIIPDLLAYGINVERVLIETHLRFMQISTVAEEYMKQMENLDRYISANSLENRWLTDWV